MEKLKAAIVWANGIFVPVVNFIRNYPKATLIIWAASLIAAAWYL